MVLHLMRLVTLSPHQCVYFLGFSCFLDLLQRISRFVSGILQRSFDLLIERCGCLSSDQNIDAAWLSPRKISLSKIVDSNSWMFHSWGQKHIKCTGFKSNNVNLCFLLLHPSQVWARFDYVTHTFQVVNQVALGPK